MDLINFQKVLMVLFLMVVKKSYEHLASYAVAASSLLPQMQNLQTRNKQQLAQRFSMHNYCAVFPRKWYDLMYQTGIMGQACYS
jgi:hypothetical protein